jgi:hypothetical protein
VANNNNHGKREVGFARGAPASRQQRPDVANELSNHCMDQSNPGRADEGESQTLSDFELFQCIGKATRAWRDVPGDQIAIGVINLEERVDSVQFRQADDRLVHVLFFELTDESGAKANTPSYK